MISGGVPKWDRGWRFWSDFGVDASCIGIAWLRLPLNIESSSDCAMSFPHDSRLAESGKCRTTSQPGAASDQDMQALAKRRQAPRILVVDDHPTIAGLMSQLLTQRGYDVVTAADAEQAAGEVRRQAPDLILSDVRMPGNRATNCARTQS